MLQILCGSKLDCDTCWRLGDCKANPESFCPSKIELVTKGYQRTEKGLSLLFGDEWNDWDGKETSYLEDNGFIGFVETDSVKKALTFLAKEMKCEVKEIALHYKPVERKDILIFKTRYKVTVDKEHKDSILIITDGKNIAYILEDRFNKAMKFYGNTAKYLIMKDDQPLMITDDKRYCFISQPDIGQGSKAPQEKEVTLQLYEKWKNPID